MVMALWAIAWVGRCHIPPHIFIQLPSDHAMVPFRHYPSRTSPPPSPILKYCPSHLSPSRRFSSTRYGPHTRTIKVLLDLAFEYSVPIVFIVSLSLYFILITQ